MHLLQILSLGIVQGITEFLPVSSTAHLIILPWLFKWPPHSLGFDIVLHAGTLFALMLYFGKYWMKLIAQGLSGIKKGSLAGQPQRRLFWLIVIATVPGAVIGKVLEAKAETTFRNPLLIAFTMAGFAILFYIADKRGKKNKTLYQINLFDALVVGVGQSLAFIPGVSRSGVTMFSGLALGLERESTVRFSFLLSAPIILGATLLKIKDVLGNMDFPGGLYLFIGFMGSALTGVLAIQGLLNFVKRHNFNIFIIYRIIFSFVILLSYCIAK